LTGHHFAKPNFADGFGGPQCGLKLDDNYSDNLLVMRRIGAPRRRPLGDRVSFAGTPGRTNTSL
jgi:hypothetical protein